jgi:hypothetical protein
MERREIPEIYEIRRARHKKKERRMMSNGKKGRNMKKSKCEKKKSVLLS